jgi:hypothetical protein
MAAWGDEPVRASVRALVASVGNDSAAPRRDARTVDPLLTMEEGFGLREGQRRTALATASFLQFTVSSPQRTPPSKSPESP